MMLITLIIITLTVNSSKAIVVPSELPIDSLTLKATKEINNLLRTLSCFEKFITTSMDQDFLSLTVLLFKNEDFKSAQYLHYLQQTKSINIINNNNNNHQLMREQSMSQNVLIILSHPRDLEKFSSFKLNELCGGDCKFTILLASPLISEENFINEAKKIVEFLWIKKISNAVIVGSVGNIFLAAESRSFRPNVVPQPEDPAIVGQCQDGNWIVSGHFFSSMKMNNCFVNIAYFDEEPYIHEIVKNNNEKELVGLEALMIKSIADYLNFTVNLTMINWQGLSLKPDRAAKELNSNKSIDLVIGNVYWRPDQRVDFTISYDAVGLVWLVPVQSKFSLRGLITPLDDSVWLATGAVLLFAVCLRFLLFNKLSFLELVAVILGVAWNKQPQTLPYRIKLMSWIIFGYLLIQFYSASLSSTLLAGSNYKINSMAQLVESELKFGGVPNTELIFNRAENKSEIQKTPEDKIKLKIYKRYNIFSRELFKKKLYDLISGGNNKLALVALLNASSIDMKLNPRIVYIMPETLSTVKLGFPAKRNLVYLNEINKTLRKLWEGGIIYYMGQILLPSKSRFNENNEDDGLIRLDNLIPGFCLLAFGYILSFLTVLCEIIFSRLKLKNKSQGLNKKIKKRRKNKIIIATDF